MHGATPLTLLVKILCSKEIYTHSIQTTLDMAANLAFGVEITPVVKSQNIFRLKFNDESDCEKLRRTRIWHVKGHLMILKKWSPDTPINEINFSATEF